MGAVSELVTRLGANLVELRGLVLADLRFERPATAVTALLLLASLPLLVLAVRRLLRSAFRRDRRIAVPAVLPTPRRRPRAATRHLALMFVLAGLPPFALALADPFTTVAERQVSYPGRRIALLIDASSSMLKPFAESEAGQPARSRAAFFTSVSAAEVFIRQRREGRYRDVMALIEFGDEAYVITPFTSDYDNILLSTALIGDWSEFMRFPNQGTKIAAALEQGIRLFRAFDFLEAAGNLMVIFSDGEDTQVTLHGRHVNDILSGAVKHRIPVYLIRTNRDKALGEVVPDSIWKPAVESTGGRFYAAANENDVRRAITEIDRRSQGAIQMTQYSTNQRRFAPLALAAVALWSIGLALQLTLPHFRTLP
jgi:hypothetical protein